MSPPVELHAGLRDQRFDQRPVRLSVRSRLSPSIASRPIGKDMGRPSGAQAINVFALANFYAKREPIIEAMKNARLPAIFY